MVTLVEPRNDLNDEGVVCDIVGFRCCGSGCAPAASGRMDYLSFGRRRGSRGKRLPKAVDQAPLERCGSWSRAQDLQRAMAAPFGLTSTSALTVVKVFPALASR